MDKEMNKETNNWKRQVQSNREHQEGSSNNKDGNEDL